MILFPDNAAVCREQGPFPHIVGGVDPAEMVRVITGLVDNRLCAVVVRPASPVGVNEVVVDVCTFLGYVPYMNKRLLCSSAALVYRIVMDQVF